MAKIVHLVSEFDPAGDVYRCVGELNKHSKHSHRLVIRRQHPAWKSMRLPAPEIFEPDCNGQFDGAAAVVCHFHGWPLNWPKRPDVPFAFRNLNIRLDDKDKFWCDYQFTAHDLDTYKIIGSSHVGAEDFMRADGGKDKPFRWLPDLLDIWAPEMTPDFSRRAVPAVSYIKHARSLDRCEFGPVVKQSLDETPHAEILERRRTAATVVVDNVCDGHWGLSGHEALSLGLPTIVYIHPKTRAAMDLVDAHWPFVEAKRCVPMFNGGDAAELEEVVSLAKDVISWPAERYDEFRRAVRSWTERHLDSNLLIERFWEPFFEELLA